MRYLRIAPAIGVAFVLSLILSDPAQAQFNTYIGVQGGVASMTAGGDRTESLSVVDPSEISRLEFAQLLEDLKETLKARRFRACPVPAAVR
ncbi:hypothetical protein [Salinibacter ruber]|uniref:hypothetical protein n=1 Tax=Salinibacter ruber TaxID=146919 RepID=UPI0021687C77|nr:hypothetical protein [Salinibacter ruber]MCS4198559.1 hypothetical protein [Salinibacter ruber]